MNYDFFHIDINNLVNFGLLTKNALDLLPMTLIFNRFRANAKYNQAKCSRSWVIVRTSFFRLFRNGKKSENPVL